MKSALALTVALACFAPLAANAKVTQEVKAGSNLPTVVQLDQGVLFHVKNPSDRMIKFNVPELGISCDIPRHSQDTFFVDTARMPSPEATFSIQSWDGKTEASGKLLNSFVYYEPTSLGHIINYDTSYTFDEKPAPRYKMRRH